MNTCKVVRTHRRGVLLHQKDWGKPVEGHIHMYTTAHPILRRAVTVLSMESLQTFGKQQPAEIPNLLDPEFITFRSDRGMSVNGFEEIDGQRFYQGWWVQWI